MATITTLVVEKEGSYFDRSKVSSDELKKLAKEFLQWLVTRDNQKNAPNGYGAHIYSDLAFYVFHDNVKSQGSFPLYDLSTWLQYLYENQKELGCRVWQTPMVDNKYHPPQGSHPGRCIILTPPTREVYEKGAKVSANVAKSIKDHVLDGCNLTKEDRETLNSIVAAA